MTAPLSTTTADQLAATGDGAGAHDVTPPALPTETLDRISREVFARLAPDRLSVIIWRARQADDGAASMDDLAHEAVLAVRSAIISEPEDSGRWHLLDPVAVECAVQIEALRALHAWWPAASARADDLEQLVAGVEAEADLPAEVERWLAGLDDD